jgi:hypothetical protein
MKQLQHSKSLETSFLIMPDTRIHSHTKTESSGKQQQHKPPKKALDDSQAPL